MKAEFSESLGDLKLKKAFLVYGKSKDDSSLVTIHDIAIVNEAPVILEGKLVSSKSMQKMAKTILKMKTANLSLIQDTVIAQNEDVLVWWVPSQIKRVYFKSNDAGLSNVSAEVTHPPLLFVKTTSDLMVLALSKNVRPGLESKLLFSPFFNVWDSHRVCLGSTKIPASDNVIEWTNAFFNSAFTHENYTSSQAKLKKSNRARFWDQLMNGKIKKFPASVLPSAGITVGQLLEELAE